MSKVYIIHGWTYSLSAWEKLVPILKKKHEIVQLKVPGLTTKDKSVWDINSYVLWLHEQVKDEKDLQIIAHSNGGRITLNYDNSYPSHIKNLILIDSAGVPRNEMSMSLKRSVFKAMAKVGKKLTRSEVAKKILYKAASAGDYNRAPENMKQTLQNMLKSDESLDLKTISAPTHLIWGDRDDATPISDAHTMNSEIGSSTLDVIEGAGHSPHNTHTEIVSKLVLEKLK